MICPVCCYSIGSDLQSKQTKIGSVKRKMQGEKSQLFLTMQNQLLSREPKPREGLGQERGTT